jgi:repressor LexA
MSTRLSEPQQRIFDFILHYIRMEGRPPTNREIGHAVGMSSTGHVDHHLTALEEKGMITRVHGKSRGIRVKEEHVPGLRVIGAIAAGVPLDYYPDTEQTPVDLNEHMTSRAYVLLVKGNSMIEDHIANGDYVLIEPDPDPQNGAIVVATHLNAVTEGGAATLKRFYREHGQVRLQPANSEMQPIIIPAEEWDDEWQVQGRVIAVYRRC